jgi:hypothetical protein
MINGAAFSLQWIPRKMFQLYSPDYKTRLRLYDTFGFFQSSFVQALSAWNIEDPHGEIKRMKTERARFEREQYDEIRQYCLSECRLLVALMDKLDASMKSAGITLRSYMGAGSVAGALLQKERVKKSHESDSTYSEQVQAAIYSAYFGGRIEIFQQGIFENVLSYDIVSAYPYQCLSLPRLKDGQWRKAKLEEIVKPKLDAIWRVEWDVTSRRDVMPFPLRKKQSIYYPQNGRGWFHHAEVQAALALYPDEINVLEGHVFEPANDEKPFAFVREYFAKRQEAKERGDPAEKAYKLGLNSLYGKTAQGIAYKGEPPFRSLYWAGKITSGTRARLLDCASLWPSGVISIATDGIVFNAADRPVIEESKALGGFERTQIDELFIAQPGIYYARTSDGKEIKKSRGFFTREIDYDDLREGWIRDGTTFTQKAVCECGHAETRHENSHCNRCDCNGFSTRRRFIGIGVALMRKDFSVWRTWQESDRILSLNSSRKFYATEEPARRMPLLPPRFPQIIDSEPYIPKGSTLEARDAMIELVSQMEQPLEIEGGE